MFQEQELIVLVSCVDVSETFVQNFQHDSNYDLNNINKYIIYL